MRPTNTCFTVCRFGDVILYHGERMKGIPNGSQNVRIYKTHQNAGQKEVLYYVFLEKQQRHSCFHLFSTLNSHVPVFVSNFTCQTVSNFKTPEQSVVSGAITSLLLHEKIKKAIIIPKA